MATPWDPGKTYNRGESAFYGEYIYMCTVDGTAGGDPRTSTYTQSVPDEGGLTRRRWLPIAGSDDQVEPIITLDGAPYDATIPMVLRKQRGAGQGLDPNISTGGPPGMFGPTKGFFQYLHASPVITQFNRKTSPFMVNARWPSLRPFDAKGPYDINGGATADFDSSSSDNMFTVSSDRDAGSNAESFTSPNGFNIRISAGVIGDNYRVILEIGPGESSWLSLSSIGLGRPYVSEFMSFISQYGKDFKYRIKVDKRVRSEPDEPWGPWTTFSDEEGILNTGNNIDTCQPNNVERNFAFNPIFEELRMDEIATGFLEMQGEMLDLTI